jgi:hypothetical protein
MSRTILVAIAFWVSARTLVAGPPPDEMVQKLTKTIRKHCPQAKIEVTRQAFVARFGTMRFTIHGRSKTGQFDAGTYQQEGPNFKGFILRVALQEGKYAGAAVVPQILQGPYFPTFIDALSVEQDKKHYLIRFSCGSRLDPDLKKAIFEVLRRTGFQPAAAPADVDKVAAARAAARAAAAKAAREKQTLTFPTPAKDSNFNVDFAEVSISIRDFKARALQQPELIRVRGDGICEYRIEGRPARGGEPRWPPGYQEHKVAPKRLRRLEELLKKTAWLSAKGYEGRAGHADATKYTLTVKRKGQTRTIAIEGEKGEPYKSLVSFFRGVALQENLLYRLDRVPEKSKEACRQIDEFVRAERGEPYGKPPFEVDLRRYRPMFSYFLVTQFDRPTEEVAPAIRLLGHLRSERDRAHIAELANDRDRIIRVAVSEALGSLGGKESLPILRRMVRSTDGAAFQLIRLGPLAVPTIVEVIESGSARANALQPSLLDYQRLIRAYVDHWKEVPKPIDPRVLAAVRKSMAAPKDNVSSTEYHKKLLDLASRPKPAK